MFSLSATNVGGACRANIRLQVSHLFIQSMHLTSSTERYSFLLLCRERKHGAAKKVLKKWHQKAQTLWYLCTSQQLMLTDGWPNEDSVHFRCNFFFRWRRGCEEGVSGVGCNLSVKKLKMWTALDNAQKKELCKTICSRTLVATSCRCWGFLSPPGFFLSFFLLAFLLKLLFILFMSF